LLNGTQAIGGVGAGPNGSEAIWLGSSSLGTWASMGAIQEHQTPNTIASASTIAPSPSLATGGNVFVVTGTTTINLIDRGVAWQPGVTITCLFSGATTLKHNQAPSGTQLPMMLAGSVDMGPLTANTRVQFTLMLVGGVYSWWQTAPALVP
jgi:hypothetical protein